MALRRFHLIFVVLTFLIGHFFLDLISWFVLLRGSFAFPNEHTLHEITRTDKNKKSTTSNVK